jgi:phospholipid/cholesterol/gamma-HCH transport system substrate-binding protein
VPRAETRIASAAALIVVVVALVVIVAGIGGGSTHSLYAGFDNSIQMVPGQEVRIAGRSVGEIGTIRLDKESGTSVVQLKITDDAVWPLPKGTYAVSRWGSTTAYLGRYTEVIPGPRRNPPLPDGGILKPQQDQTAFELDQAYRIFRGRTAGDTSALLNRLGDTLHGQGPAVQRGLAAAPSGLGQTADLLANLSTNDYDLRTLAVAGDRAVTALASRSADLGRLVQSAAGTFDTFAQHTTDEQRALDRAPRAFRTATSTFARLDTSLNGLTTLVDTLRPGAPALAQLAGTTAVTLRTLRNVAPQATAALNAGTAAAPPLTRLFTTGETVMPAVARALRTFTPMFACLRPYAPDLAGFLSTWPGFTSHYDAGGHYGRAFELTVIPALYPGTALNSQQAMAVSPGLTYAFPRPPGMNDGHPYFIPQCGITPAALNPADDPEGAAK